MDPRRSESAATRWLMKLRINKQSSGSLARSSMENSTANGRRDCSCDRDRDRDCDCDRDRNCDHRCRCDALAAARRAQNQICARRHVCRPVCFAKLASTLASSAAGHFLWVAEANINFGKPRERGRRSSWTKPTRPVYQTVLARNCNGKRAQLGRRSAGSAGHGGERGGGAHWAAVVVVARAWAWQLALAGLAGLHLGSPGRRSPLSAAHPAMRRSAAGWTPIRASSSEVGHFLALN